MQQRDKIVKNGNKVLKTRVDFYQFEISFKELSRALPEDFLDVVIQMRLVKEISPVCQIHQVLIA